jgi:hypothetical protein
VLVRIADDVPVVMLARALSREGFLLSSTPEGLVLRVSPSYQERGECCGDYVPAFLRYQPSVSPPTPAAFFICPDV